jgi:DNA-directed RNA polymerase subunit RPC12/RpoP
LRRLLWLAVAGGLVAVVAGWVDARYVFAPLLGLLIWRIGVASLGSLRAGVAHIPQGDPVAVDPSTERVTYWCAGCGAELLLLVRGAEVPPRHCGERMIERHEIVRAALN